MKPIIELATLARQRLQDVWFEPAKGDLEGKQLYCKCRGLVMGDRIESAIINDDWRFIYKDDKK